MQIIPMENSDWEAIQIVEIFSSLFRYLEYANKSFAVPVTHANTANLI